MNIPRDALLGEVRVVPVRRKSPVLAAILSIFPGLGQVYVGAYRRGFTYVGIFAGLIVLLSSGSARGIEPGIGVMMSFFFLYNMIDASRLAQLFNDAADGITTEELRREFIAGIGQRGSIGGGVALFVGGMLFLLHVWFDMPMEWIADWWPLVPVGLGAWLIYAGIRDKRKGVRGTVQENRP